MLSGIGERASELKTTFDMVMTQPTYAALIIRAILSVLLSVIILQSLRTRLVLVIFSFFRSLGRYPSSASQHAIRRLLLLNSEIASSLDAAKSSHALVEEKNAIIKALEEELAALRTKFENVSRQHRESSKDLSIFSRLNDIADLVRSQKPMLDEKMQRLQNKDAELHGLITILRDDIQRIRRNTGEAKAVYENQQELLLAELHRQNNEQQELQRALHERKFLSVLLRRQTQFSISNTPGYRADTERQHEATIDVVRTANKQQTTFNVQQYFDVFSKALASEVKLLLVEVGKLREERRVLQHELGFLLNIKSKYGPNGEFDPDWKPAVDIARMSQPDHAATPHPVQEAPPVPVRPAWRTVHNPMARKKTNVNANLNESGKEPEKDAVKFDRKPGGKQKEKEPAASDSETFPLNLTPLLGSWTSWKPMAGLALPPSNSPTAGPLPQRVSELFGPRSPMDISRE